MIQEWVEQIMPVNFRIFTKHSSPVLLIKENRAVWLRMKIVRDL